jgi:hypothetical protein
MKTFQEFICIPEEVVKEGHGPWGKITQASLDRIAKAKKREEKEKGVLRRPGSTLRKDTTNYVAKVNKLSEEDDELDESAAWQRKEGKRESGGLNQKGVDSYRRENPGSKLKTAVTTKPSKLKPGSAAANRRKSFCARMSGMKKRLTSAKTANDPDSRINKSLRKWNC